MATIAVFSPKGGVGKTSLAVNLAWALATFSSRRTLLWDLDAQAAASFILAPDRERGDEASAVIKRGIAPGQLIVPTAIERLHLLPADDSLRALDVLFTQLDAKNRLLRIVEGLQLTYDRIVIDCPPGLGVVAEQVVRGASLIVLPLIPSTLAMRASDELFAYLGNRRKGAPTVLPVFNMVDRRRLAHRQALAAAPDRPALPIVSLVEQMADRHAPLGVYAPRASITKAILALSAEVERLVAESSIGGARAE